MEGNKASGGGEGAGSVQREGMVCFEMKPVKAVGAHPAGSYRHFKDFGLKCSEKALEGVKLRTDITGFAFQDPSVSPTENRLKVSQSEFKLSHQRGLPVSIEP